MSSSIPHFRITIFSPVSRRTATYWFSFMSRGPISTLHLIRQNCNEIFNFS
jgi:hypothetical protein